MKKLLDIILPVGKGETTSFHCMSESPNFSGFCCSFFPTFSYPCCSLHSVVFGQWCLSRSWLWVPDAVGAAVLPPEQRDCCEKGLLLCVPAAQVLICSDVHVLGFASKLCDLWNPALCSCTPLGGESHTLVLWLGSVAAPAVTCCSVLPCRGPVCLQRRVSFFCLSSLCKSVGSQCFVWGQQWICEAQQWGCDQHCCCCCLEGQWGWAEGTCWKLMSRGRDGEGSLGHLEAELPHQQWSHLAVLVWAAWKRATPWTWRCPVCFLMSCKQTLELLPGGWEIVSLPSWSLCSTREWFSCCF